MPIWVGEEDRDDAWRAEVARVELGESGLRATGTQLGVDPVPYRLDYRLDAWGEGFVTRSLRVEAVGEGWERRLRLERDDSGEWSAEVGGEGALDLPAPGGDASGLGEALDCDLGLSPLTNTMPVRRHSLHTGAGERERDFLMAWVSVPDLSVHASRQRYEHLRREGDGAVVRYASVEDGRVVFMSDLELDADGLVRVYPRLGRRLGG